MTASYVGPVYGAVHRALSFFFKREGPGCPAPPLRTTDQPGPLATRPARRGVRPGGWAACRRPNRSSQTGCSPYRKIGLWWLRRRRQSCDDALKIMNLTHKDTARAHTDTRIDEVCMLKAMFVEPK